MSRLASMSLALLSAGCVSLEPPLPLAQPQIPAGWPLPPDTPVARTSPGDGATATPYNAVADIGWRDFFVDANLKELIARALAGNRDLRVAVLNVERARALYRVRDAERLPAVGAGFALARSGGGNAPSTSTYSASIGIVDFELDLFGRVRSLGEAALQQYFATQEARRGAQLSLIAEVANIYLTLAADRALLSVSQATLANHEAAFRLTEGRYKLGAVSGLDLAQARTSVETARADTARFAGLVAQDSNALALVVGAPLDADLLPRDFGAQVSGLQAVSAGLPSEVLLRRPDVLRAEHALRAANANIGAARAAYFPSIRLTGSAGTASDALSGLFRGGSFVWSVMPGVNLPIFTGGRLDATLAVAQAERDVALALYEKSIQAGFREVADALALSRSLAGQRAAQEALLEASTRAEALSRARYASGRDGFPVLLDAQRTRYAAEQGLVATRLAEQTNRVTLYKALGGGWK